MGSGIENHKEPAAAVVAWNFCTVPVAPPAMPPPPPKRPPPAAGAPKAPACPQ